MNYYEEVGVSPSASAEEIRRAYREPTRVFGVEGQVAFREGR